MLRTAYSQILNSSRDFSTAVFDGQGRLAAQAEHVPIHVGALPWAVASVADFFKGRIAPGDMYLLNDPYHGNNHLPDLTVLCPCSSASAALLVDQPRAPERHRRRDPRRLQPGRDRDLAGGHPHHRRCKLYDARRAPRRRAADGRDQRAPSARFPGRSAGDDGLGARRGAAAAQAGRRVRPRRPCSQRWGESSTARSGRPRSASAAGRTACIKGEAVLDDDGHGIRDIHIRATVTKKGDRSPSTSPTRTRR